MSSAWRWVGQHQQAVSIGKLWPENF